MNKADLVQQLLRSYGEHYTLRRLKEDFNNRFGTNGQVLAEEISSLVSHFFLHTRVRHSTSIHFELIPQGEGAKVIGEGMHETSSLEIIDIVISCLVPVFYLQRRHYFKDVETGHLIRSSTEKDTPELQLIACHLDSLGFERIFGSHFIESSDSTEVERTDPNEVILFSCLFEDCKNAF